VVFFREEKSVPDYRGLQVQQGPWKLEFKRKMDDRHYRFLIMIMNTHDFPQTKKKRDVTGTVCKKNAKPSRSQSIFVVGGCSSAGIRVVAPSLLGTSLLAIRVSCSLKKNN